MKTASLLSFVVAATLIPQVGKAIVIDGRTAATNDRFANDSSFIMDSYDLSGVGLNTQGRWLTMLSPNVFITATHFRPGNGTSVTFYESNDPSGNSVTRVVSSTQHQVGADTDIWLGTLSEALPQVYTFYDFAVEDIVGINGKDGFNTSLYNGADAYVFGRSPGSYSVSEDMAVGRNRLDRWFGEITAASNTGDAIGANIDQSGDADYVPYEADLRSGDSGAPLFVDNGSGGLSLVGINWFISNPQGSFIGQSYVGNYDEEIQNFIDTYSVPEPTSFALVLGIASLLIRQKRRSRLPVSL